MKPLKVLFSLQILVIVNAIYGLMVAIDNRTLWLNTVVIVAAGCVAGYALVLIWRTRRKEKEHK